MQIQRDYGLRNNTYNENSHTRARDYSEQDQERKSGLQEGVQERSGQEAARNKNVRVSRDGDTYQTTRTDTRGESDRKGSSYAKGNSYFGQKEQTSEGKPSFLMRIAKRFWDSLGDSPAENAANQFSQDDKVTENSSSSYEKMTAGSFPLAQLLNGIHGAASGILEKGRNFLPAVPEHLPQRVQEILRINRGSLKKDSDSFTALTDGQTMSDEEKREQEDQQKKASINTKKDPRVSGTPLHSSHLMDSYGRYGQYRTLGENISYPQTIDKKS